MIRDDDSGVEAVEDDVVPFFLETGRVPSFLGFAAQEQSLPKEESLPVGSVLQKLFYRLLFPYYSGWYHTNPPKGVS